MDKFELAKILSEILQNYGFYDSINIFNYNFDKAKNHINGIFSENQKKYSFSLDFNNGGDVTHLAWIKIDNAL